MDKAPTPSTRTEFIASWNDWDGAVCVTLEAYEAMEKRAIEAERRLSALNAREGK